MNASRRETPGIFFQKESREPHGYLLSTLTIKRSPMSGFL